MENCKQQDFGVYGWLIRFLPHTPLKKLSELKKKKKEFSYNWILFKLFMKLLLHGITAALQAGSDVLLNGSILFSPLQKGNLEV